MVPNAQQGFGVMTDTLRVMIENQQTVQNSLQVNRNLLGVIIQDNFNLKEENAKLRERMLKRRRSELATQGGDGPEAAPAAATEPLLVRPDRSVAAAASLPPSRRAAATAAWYNPA